MPKPPLLAAILSILIALISSGCSRFRAPAQAPPAIQIEFWTLALRPFFDDYVQARLAEFESAHPGVTVKWVDVPFDAMDRKLIASAAAGRAPDLINFSDKTFARFVSLGAMTDLGPLLPPPGASETDSAARYVPGAFRLGRIGGKLLALPWYLTTQTVLANTTLLAQGGLTPQTLGSDWSSLRVQARPFHLKTGKFLFSVPLGTETDFPMMLLAEGLPPFKQDPSGRLRADLTRPEVVALVTEWVNLFRDGALPREAVTGGSAHLAESYQNGRVALINSGPNFLKRIGDIAPTIFNATQTLPPITGALHRAHIAVMVLCVSSRSKHPALAAELAWHMTSPAAQEALCALVPILPSTRASLDRPMFNFPARVPTPQAPYSTAERLTRARAITAEALKDAVAFTPSLAAWPEMRRAFEDRIKTLLLDKSASIPAALQAIDAEWNRILDASGETDYAAIPTAEPR